MLRLLIDENLNHRILRGVRLQIPNLDYVIVQATPHAGEADPSLLVWSAETDRVLVTHDVNTMPRFVAQRLRAHLSVPGVVVVRDRMPIGQAVEELAIVVECNQPQELRNRILYLPL